MPRARFRVSALIAQAHLGFAAARKIALDDVLAAFGVSRADTEDDERELPVELVNALWTAVSERTGDPAYGLHLAEQQAPVLGILDYCMRHAATVRDALGKLFAYQRLLHGPVHALSLEEQPEVARLCFRPPLPAEALPAQVPQFALARVLTMMRRYGGRPVVPRRASFRHPAPRDLSEHRRVFGCPLAFGEPVDALDLDAGPLEAPLPAADPTLDAILDRQARDMLARHPGEDDLVSRVKQAIADAIQGGAPDADALARRLAMSGRTLRRRLEKEGTTYQELLDDVRAELAGAYLRNPRIKTAEVAFLLGFADVGTFYRAFRRWTGTTPLEYRRADAAP